MSGLSKPMSARDTSFSTTRSRPLRASLAARALDAVAPGLGREADEHLTRAGARRRWPRGCRSSPRARATRCPRVPASPPSVADRPVVGDGRGHQHDVGGRRLRERLALELGGRLDVDRPRRGPDAPARSRRARRRRHHAARPRPRAPRPCGPSCGCRGSAPGSSGSRVPPDGDEDAPARRACRAAAAASAIASAIAAGSAMRPIPHSPSASAPSTGPTSTTPRSASVATLARVAGCSHMRTFIAGATTSGPGAASALCVTTLSARPCASFASVFAVHGAMHTSGALREASRCGYCRRAPARRAAPGGG